MNTNKNVYFFGEKAAYIDANDEKEAKTYLEFWKKNSLKKLSRDCFDAKIIDEQWGVRDAIYDGPLSITFWMWIKIAVQIEFKFEIPQLGSE